MSWVTNLMVLANLQDQSTVGTLSRWLEDAAPRRPGGPAAPGVGSLKSLTDARDNRWGGGKNPECNLWGGALNHADLQALLAKCASLPWKYPGAVQLFLMDQEETYFRLYMFREGSWKQFAPEPPEVA